MAWEKDKNEKNQSPTPVLTGVKTNRLKNLNKLT